LQEDIRRVTSGWSKPLPTSPLYGCPASVLWVGELFLYLLKFLERIYKGDAGIEEDLEEYSSGSDPLAKLAHSRFNRWWNPA
jgi:hypothetical protein